MIGTRLRSMTLVAGATASALAFYMVTLRVSSERAAVQRLERRIAVDMSDIRNLQSELGTRSRLPQLERWNSEVLALSAPKSNQYLNGEVELATFLDARKPAMEVEVRQAVLVEPKASAADAPIQTVAYTPAAPAAAPARSAEAKPDVRFAVASEPAPQRPLLHQASYQPGAASAARPASRAMFSDALLGEIRDTARQEAKSLRQAKVR